MAKAKPKEFEEGERVEMAEGRLKGKPGVVVTPLIADTDHALVLFDTGETVSVAVHALRAEKPAKRDK